MIDTCRKCQRYLVYSYIDEVPVRILPKLRKQVSKCNISDQVFRIQFLNAIIENSHKKQQLKYKFVIKSL